MKRILFLQSLMLIFISMPIFSQITTYEKPEKVGVVLLYDSLENLCAENALQHIGQTLYIKGSSYAKENGFKGR